MGTGRARLLAGLAAGAAGVAVLAACASATGPAPAAAVAAVAPAAPLAPPASVPGLGRMALGSFPATPNGARARTVCEQWAGLRGQYAAGVRTMTPFQLEQWFSGPAWHPAFVANRPLKTDPAYSSIDTAFGLVSTGAAASISSARLLDAACAAAR